MSPVNQTLREPSWAYCPPEALQLSFVRLSTLHVGIGAGFAEESFRKVSQSMLRREGFIHRPFCDVFLYPHNYVG